VKNKILEAMASGAPIVATSRSLSGTPLIEGRHALIADDDAKFGDSVARLLADSALRGSLSREARRKVEAEHSWNSVAAAYEGVYREALADRDRQPSGALTLESLSNRQRVLGKSK
jgi:glycosyltransferase involved in cell wall biosynthesis